MMSIWTPGKVFPTQEPGDKAKNRTGANSQSLDLFTCCFLIDKGGNDDPVWLNETLHTNIMKIKQ